jgi:hypothetical protein
MNGNIGMQCVKEFPDYRVLLVSHVCDLDIRGTYPNVSQLLNIARETCVMEFSKMQGITEEYRREVGVNLTACSMNAVEICEKILGAPPLDTLLAEFERSIGKKPDGDGLDLVVTNSPPRAIEDIPL